MKRRTAIVLVVAAALLGGPAAAGALTGGITLPAHVDAGPDRGGQVVLDPLKNYPDAENTGPSGILTVVNNDVVLTKPNEVLRNVEIRGTLTIAATATGARVENVSIVWPTNRSVGGRFTMVDSRASDVQISRCIVNGNGRIQAGLFLVKGPVLVDHCEVTGTGDAVQVGDDVTITNSYLHGMSLGPQSDWHVDTIQLVGGKNLTLEHNTIINEFPQTSAVGVWSDLGPVDHVMVRNNLIGGGGYSVYAYRMSYPMTDIQFINNRFTNMVFARVSYWATQSNGYDGVVYPTGRPSGLVWQGNVYHESGLPLLL